MTQFIDLSDFGFLSVRGKDAAKFMQGYTTSDVNRLSADKHLGAVCNLQGRVLTNYRAAEIDGGLLFRMHRSLVGEIIEFLSKYIVFSKAELADESERWHCYGVLGASPSVETGQVLLNLGNERFELWSEAALPASSDGAEWAAAAAAAAEVWIQQGTSAGFLPQSLGLADLGGIDFDKGCYLGQEIVARSQYRGELKRRLYRGGLETDARIGDSVESDAGRDIGTIVAVHGQTILAVVNNRSAEPVIGSVKGKSLTLSPVFEP